MMERRPITVIHTVGSMRSHAGGPPRSISQLLDHQARLGIKVHLLTADVGAAGGEWVLPSDDSVVLHRVPAYYWRAGRVLIAPQFRRRLMKIAQTACQPVILHDHGVWLSVNHDCACIARKLKIPRIVSPRGALMRWAMHHKLWKKKLAWLVYQRCDLNSTQVIHSTSPVAAEDMRSLGLTNQIAVIPNGITMPALPAVEKTQPPTALFLSRLNPKKGLLNLVAAWAIVRPPHWRCLIVGPDENNHRSGVERAIKRAALSEVFSFQDEVSDQGKWALYAAAQFFVLPTYSESFGMVAGEALASGIPVVTTKGTPWPELETARCGWWTDVGIEPLVKALRMATSVSDQERAAMGARGRAIVAEKCAWHTIATRMVAVYQWMCTGGSLPPGMFY